jgi:hypothetical protein
VSFEKNSPTASKKEFTKMNIVKIIALTATLVAGSVAVQASPYNVMGGLTSLNSIDQAYSASVLRVDASEASYLANDNDVASIQQRIKNNRFLSNSVAAQGYSIDQIVGVDGTETSLTLYAL